MFIRQFRLSIIFLQRSYTMVSTNKTTAQLINSRICSIERTITTLQSEVTDLKKILKALTDAGTSNVLQQSKKRKLHDGVKEESDDESDCTDYTSLEDFKVDEEGYVQVFTDGACTNNGQKDAKAGIGVWFGHDHPLNLAEPVKRRPTNNVGEIEACTRAIQQAHAHGVKKLCINTDSEFTINCMTKWINGWLKKNWMTAAGKPVINKDELLELLNTKKLLEDVKFKYVKGHKGIEGNEAADNLARQGAAMYKAR